MAIAVESSSTTTPAVLTRTDGYVSFDIAKPLNLAVGDFMLALILDDTVGGEIGATWASTGWTHYQYTKGATGINVGTAILYKTATAGDVAGSSFTFTVLAPNNRICGGGIMRISGAKNVNPIGASNVDNTKENDGDPTFANTITPPKADSLIIICANAVFNNNFTGGYAITTSNPVAWTEIWDAVSAAGDNYTMATAVALRPETTATGNSDVTGADATADWVGYQIAINPYEDPIAYTMVADTGYFTLTGKSTLISSIRRLVVAMGSFTLSGANIITSIRSLLKWANIAKNTATSENVDKNNASVTNTTKHNSITTNTEKSHG